METFLPLYLLMVAWAALSCPVRLRIPLAWLLPAVTVTLALRAEGPGQRLLFASLWTLYALKGSLLLQWAPARVRAMSRPGLALYLSLWPGMDARPLERRDPEVGLPGGWFVQGWVTMLVGAVGLLAMPLFHLSSPWLGLVGLLTLVHLGYSDLLSALVRWAGFPVKRLFCNPLLSSGLRDFWSLRWNRPFVEMNRLLFVPLLARFLTPRASILGAFLISGLLHEMAISLPVRAGWGGPLAYFVLQGLAMHYEGRLIKGRPGWQRRLWTWAWLLVPVPLLFHDAFRRELIGGLLGVVASLPALQSPQACLGWLLWLAGWGHFLVLAASFQVPRRLGWYEELTRLRPLNRKLLWVYGGFIVGMIASLGLLLLRLRPLILARETGALHVAALAAVFWSCRLLVDALVFEHSDWPQGPDMVVGHTLLNSLFVFLATTCWLSLFWG